MHKSNVFAAQKYYHLKQLDKDQKLLKHLTKIPAK